MYSYVPLWKNGHIVLISVRICFLRSARNMTSMRMMFGIQARSVFLSSGFLDFLSEASAMVRGFIIFQKCFPAHSCVSRGEQRRSFSSATVFFLSFVRVRLLGFRLPIARWTRSGLPRSRRGQRVPPSLSSSSEPTPNLFLTLLDVWP